MECAYATTLVSRCGYEWEYGLLSVFSLLSAFSLLSVLSLLSVFSLPSESASAYA
mgnify:CR=1 FL=1